MWAETTIKILSRLYLALLVGLIVIFSIRPDTIGDLIPGLPFDIDWTDARMIFNLTITIIVVAMLFTWEKRQTVFRFISLGHSQTNSRFTRVVNTIMLVIALLATPVLFVFPPNFQADSQSLDQLEEAYINRVKTAGTDVLRPKTKPSPDPPRDHLAFTRLPVMNLEIPDISQHELAAILPKANTGQATKFSRYSGNNFSWPYVPAFFSYAGKRYPVDIRYRGWHSDHYLGFKKSWRIKFRKDDLFFGRRQFNLVNQRDHSLVNDILWSELLRDSGLLVPYQFLVHLRINDRFVGIQTFLEQPDRYFAERHNRNVCDIYGEIKPITSQGGFLSADSWQQYASHSDSKNIQPLIDMYTAVYRKDADDYLTELERHLDVDHYLKYLAHGMINCQENPSTHNIRWIRDPAIGRFQILPWYQAPPHFILTGYHDLWKRKGWDFHPPMTAINDIADGLLRRPEMRHRCLVHLWRLLRSTHHPDRIRQRIDELHERFRPDAYADNHMHYGGDMRRYISTAEWEETIDRIRHLTSDRIKYLERALAGGPLRTETYKNTLTLTTTNYSDSVIAEIAFQIADRPGNLQIGEHSYAPTSVNGDRVTYRPRHRLSSAASRTPLPLGPGIIIADLDRVLNKDLDFIGSSSQLAAHYRPQETSVTMLMPGPLLSLSVTNAVTSLPLAIDALSSEKPRTPEQTLNPIRPDGIVLTDRPTQLRSIVVSSSHTVSSNWHIATDEHLVVRPNVTLRFAPGTSLIVRGQMTAIGTEQAPISFTSADPAANWGVVFLNSLSVLTNRFQHCLFEKSANVLINGMPVTASLAAYTAPVTVSNCVFRHTAADDAFNSKYVSPVIDSCTFSNNLDAIDIDMGGGLVIGSRFIDNRDDCIDLSSSWARIENNFIKSFGDKGISVGEKSKPTIVNNHISDATMGVAVKDLSHAIFKNNTITNNRQDIALYQKKPSFGPGTARIDGRLLTNNLPAAPQ